MAYVFDTNCFIVIGHYYPEQFPSFWEKFNQTVESDKIISVREVRRELDINAAEDHLIKWIKLHKNIFVTPSPAVMRLVNDIFSVPHFRVSLPDRTRLGNNPFADPFVIAQAKVMNYCVVTQESEKPHAARIPNICGHFDVDWTNLQGFMERENWSF